MRINRNTTKTENAREQNYENRRAPETSLLILQLQKTTTNQYTYNIYNLVSDLSCIMFIVDLYIYKNPTHPPPNKTTTKICFL